MAKRENDLKNQIENDKALVPQTRMVRKPISKKLMVLSGITSILSLATPALAQSSSDGGTGNAGFSDNPVAYGVLAGLLSCAACCFVALVAKDPCTRYIRERRERNHAAMEVIRQQRTAELVARQKKQEAELAARKRKQAIEDTHVNHLVMARYLVNKRFDQNGKAAKLEERVVGNILEYVNNSPSLNTQALSYAESRLIPGIASDATQASSEPKPETVMLAQFNQNLTEVSQRLSHISIVIQRDADPKDDSISQDKGKAESLKATTASSV